MNSIRLVSITCCQRQRWARRASCAALLLVGPAGVAAALEQMQHEPAAMAAPAFTLGSESYPDTTTPNPAKSATIHYTDITGWLSPRQASSLGLSLGVLSGDMGMGMGNTPIAYALGVRWRTQLNSHAQFNVHAWARTPQADAMHDAMGMIWLKDQPSFGTRLEVQWSSSRTHGLIPEFGAIGVQLQGDSRLLLRARSGGPVLYYRTRF